MKLSDMTSVWDADLSKLSGRDRGMVYYQRCQLVLNEAIRNRRAMVTNNRIDREWLRAEIGCGASVLRQNDAIRVLLEEKDGLFAGLAVTHHYNRRSTHRSSRNTRHSANSVQDVRSIRFTGNLRFVELTFDSNPYTVPVLLWNGRIDIEVSGWLRYLAVRVKAPITSLRTYSSIIRDFTRFRRRHEILFDEVNDDIILKFQSHKLATGVKPETVNQYTDVIFGFYVWLEETGRITSHVQLNAADNVTLKKTEFRITSKHSGSSDRKIADSPGRVWNYRLNLSNKRKKRRATPSAKQIGRIHDAVLDQRHGERNSLLFLWAEKTGARRFEVLQINVEDLPTDEQRDEIAETGGTWVIQVHRKGRGEVKSDLHVPIDILRLTDQYVRYERSKIVERCTELGRPISNGLFLTDKGTTLGESSLTGLSRIAFIKAGVLRASYHRFRAVFATKQTKMAVEALESGDIHIVPGTNWTQTILIRVAELLDHSNLQSLEHYLTDFLNARIQRAQSETGHNLGDTLEGKRRELEALDRRIANRLRLLSIMDELGQKATSDTQTQLREIALEILSEDK